MKGRKAESDRPLHVLLDRNRTSTVLIAIGLLYDKVAPV